MRWRGWGDKEVSQSGRDKCKKLIGLRLGLGVGRSSRNISDCAV